MHYHYRVCSTSKNPSSPSKNAISVIKVAVIIAIIIDDTEYTVNYIFCVDLSIVSIWLQVIGSIDPITHVSEHESRDNGLYCHVTWSYRINWSDNSYLN